MNLFYYLIHRLVVLQIHRKDKEEEYFPLTTFNLKGVSDWNINRYRKYLEIGQFLECDKIAKKGSKKYHYRINPEYLLGSKKVELAPGSALYDSIVHRYRKRRSHWDRLPHHLKLMKDFFLDVDLDYVEARKWAESQPDEAKRHSYLTSIAMIEDRRFRYFKRNKTNFRLDTNFTSLKSELRPFIVGDYVSIDLVNSQPLLLSQVLGEIYPTITTNTIPLLYSCSILGFDLLQWLGKQQFNYLTKIHQNGVFYDFGELLSFQISCIYGVFYEDFQTRFGGGELTRDQIKEMLFSVLFSQNVRHEKYKPVVPYPKEKAQFASIYPSIYQVIKTLKHKDHAKLAVLLQRIEAKIFIDSICPELVSQGIIPLTIHDSIIIPADQTDRALRVCENVFKELFGIIPTFQVEHLKPNRNYESSE